MRSDHLDTDACYETQQRTTCKDTQIITEAGASASSSFQVLLETEIMDLITYETGDLHPFMYNIISWNIRSLNGLNKLEDISIVLNKHSIGLVGFLETKVKSLNIIKVAIGVCTGWQWHSNV